MPYSMLRRSSFCFPFARWAGAALVVFLSASLDACSSASNSAASCAGKAECDASPDGTGARGGGSSLADASTGGTSGNAGSGGRGADGSGGTSHTAEAGVPDSGLDAALDGGTATDAQTPDASTPPGWRLWVAVRNHLYAYAQTTLVATTGDEPAVDIVTNGGLGSLHFDASGALWAIGTPGLVRFSPSQLAASGMAGTPALSVSVAGVNTFAFDPAGKLWLGRVAGGDNWVGRFDLDVRTATGALTVTTTVTTAADSLPLKFRFGAYPLGMVFDEAGNLYANLDYQSAAGQGFLNRFDEAQLVGSGVFTDPPALSIMPQLFGTGVVPILRDGLGRILIPSQNAITRYSAKQVAAMGQGVQTTPETTFKLVTGNPSPYCLGLDPDGNLWVAGGGNALVRIDASDVAKTSPADGSAVMVTPSVHVRAPVSNPSADFCALAFR